MCSPTTTTATCLINPSAARAFPLPNELLLQIAFYLTEYSPTSTEYHVQSVSSLSALSRVSRRIRQAVLSQLFRSIPILKEAQLRSLRSIPAELLRHCRDLNVMMDVEFLVSMQLQEQSGHSSHSICHSLINILSKTPLLTTLRLATSDPSAWNAFPLMHAHGISINEPFQHLAPSLCPPFTLPHLRTLSLHGIEGISPLLQLTPNLETLHLSLSAGYALAVNRELVQALEFTPKLKNLAYSPDTLRLYPPASSIAAINAARGSQTNGNANSGVSAQAPRRGTADLLVAIGQKLPLLESLDLQTRWFGESTFFCSSSEPISPEELMSAMPYLPNLRHLKLPSNLASTRDFALIRAPLCSINHHHHHHHHASSPSYTIMMMPPSKSLISARKMALGRDTCAEQCFIDRVFHTTDAGEGGEKKGKLSSISFVRQVHPEDRLEYAVAYARPPGCCGADSVDVDGNGMGGVMNARMRVTRPSGEELGGPITPATMVMGPKESLLPRPIPMSSVLATSDDEEPLSDTDTDADEEMISLWEPMCPSDTPWSSFARAARAQNVTRTTTTTATTNTPTIMAKIVNSLLYADLDLIGDLNLEYDF